MTLRAKVANPDDPSLVKVTLIDGDKRVTQAVIAGPDAIPAEFSLRQNFPNPFNPTTTISFGLPDAGVVKLAVYNLLGQEVRTLTAGTMEPGAYKVVWNSLDNTGRKVSTGLYFYRLVVDNKVIATKKMLLLK